MGVDRMGPGARYPNFHKAHTLSDTVELPTGTTEIHASVTAAGSIVLQDQFGNDVSYPVDIGVYILRGQFKLAKATGTTATLSPASVVVAKGVVR